MLRLEDITVGVGGFALLEGASLHIRPGDRLGIVGPNGAGKTSLLRVIIGQSTPETGKVYPRKGLQIGYLAQKGVAGGEGSVWEEAAVGMKRLIALEARLDEARAAAERDEADAADRLGDAEEAFRLAGGYAKEERIGTVLSGLGFAKPSWSRPVRELSGGWQMRVALARLLLSDADLLVLDEPTNHLDMQARNWLAGFLKAHPATVVLVSHDRLVLDQVTTRIVEIYSAKLWGAPGNLSKWLSEREQRLAQQRQAFRMQQAEIARLERFVERFKAKATKAAQARSRQKILDRMTRIDAPELEQEPQFRLPEATESVYDVLRLKQVAIGWPKGPVLGSEIDLELHRGMRLALVGANGCGKSTLLSVISGRLAPMTGHRGLGKGLDIGCYDQDVASTLPADQTPLEYLMAMAPRATSPKPGPRLGP